MKVFPRVTNSTRMSEPKSICYDSNRQRVTGMYMKLSEALAMPKCSPERKVMEIFVGKKLLIDDDIDGVGKNLTLIIISPTWEVVGERWIQLDGEQGLEPSSPGAGLPGNPGGNGGHFLGIAREIINPESLRVTADGGAGGPGQHGGQGLPGQSGVGGYVGNEQVQRLLGNKRSYTYIPGMRGGEGGYGGRGGVGGYGGYAGTITINIGNDKHFKASAKDGENGKDGNEGLGGYRAEDTPAMTIEEYDSQINSGSAIRTEGYNVSYRHSQPHPCNDVERRKHNFSYLNQNERQLPPAKYLPNFDGVSENYNEYIKKIGGDYTLPPINPTRGNSALDFSYFFYSVHLLDLILRKCTNVRAVQFHDDPNAPRISLETSLLAAKFEELLKELRKSGAITGKCEDFDPIPMIEELKELTVKNRYDGIRRMMIARVNDFQLKPEITLEHVELRVDKLLNNIM